MRTAIWSLAALAGAAIAAPSSDGWSDGWGPEGGNDGWGSESGWGSSTTESKSLTTPVAYSNTSSVAHKTSTSSSVILTSSSSSSSSTGSASSTSTSSTSVSKSSLSSSFSSSLTTSSSVATSPISKSTVSSVVVSSSAKSSSSSVSTPVKSSSSAVSASKVSSGSVSSPVSSASKPKSTITRTTVLQSTVTVVTTVYTTVGTGTTTRTIGGHTETSTYLTTDVLTSTLTTTVKVTPSKSASGSGSAIKSGSSSVASPVTESTSFSTGTSTYTVIKSYSTGTTVVKSTSTVTVPYTVTVTVPKSTSTSPATTVTRYTTVYTTVCPATATWTHGSSTMSSVYQTTSTVTSVKTSTLTLSAPTSLTTMTSVYATTYPVTTTSVSGHSTVTKTYTTTSTITAVYTSTVTVGSPATTVTALTSVWTTVCPVTETSVSGTSTLTNTYITTSTLTGVYTSTVSNTETTLPFGTTTLTYTVATSTSSIKYPTGYHNSTVPHGTGSASKHSKASSFLPISSGSVSPVSKGSSISKPSSVSKKLSATGSVSRASSASALPSKSVSKSSSTTESTCTSAPTPYEYCVPCEGQPGNDPEKFCGYTVNDNSYEVTPKTCQVRKYEFTITNTTIAPDGVSRLGLVVNGQVPGPTIEANWGDTIQVTVHNQLQNNGSSIHFHGMRQFYTNEMDGVPSITQCALAPGDTMTYTFTADNYGTSWYHSHFSLQTYEGVFGPVVIHGPSSAPYDEEEVVMLSDWSHVPVDQMYDAAQTVGSLPDHGPRTLDTGLINGMNVWGDDGSSTQVGERFVLNVTPGKKYLLRVTSASIQSVFKFYVDGHSFTVISADFVPITPYQTDILTINIGQRYNLILEANQPVDNYWMRSDNMEPCGSITNGKNIKGIVRYAGAPVAVPTSTAYSYTEECVDEPLASLVPIVPLNAGAVDQTIAENIFINGNGGTPNLYKWTLSGTTFQSQWGDPTLYDIYNNGTIPTYSGNLAIEVPNLGDWVYVIVDSVIPVPHPIHLHGHDFFVLAQGPGLYSAATTTLNLINPPRRDVALLVGHLVIAFKADNPGVWLLHCHIGWHNSMGFAMQIIENLEGIKETVTDSCQLESTCKNWRAYALKNDIHVIDSGV